MDRGAGAGSGSHRGWPGAVVVVVLGAVLLAIPATNVARDLAVRRNPLYATLLESAVPAVLAGVVLGAGLWLVRSDRGPAFSRHVARWAVGLALGAALAAVWSLGIQVYVQQTGPKPVVLAANTVIVGAVGGLAVGIYNARVSEKRDELRAERDRFSALFENVPTSVVAVRLEDDDPIVESVNPGFEAVFGFEENELRGKNLNDYVVPVTADGRAVEPTTAQELDADRQRGEWQGDEVTLKTEDGLRDFIRLTAPVETAVRQDKYGIYIDITERKQRKERLRVLSRILRHNIRNKLTVIAGHAELLEGDTDSAAAIVEAAEELSALSERTVSIGDVVSGDRTLRPVSLRELTEDAVESVDRKHDDWTHEIDCPEDAVVQGTSALGTAIEELVENAIVHSDRDTPRVEIRATESTDGTYWEFVVADDGPGVPDTEFEEIVDETSASQLNHATGIGLWAVNWVVNDAGGELQVGESDLGGTAVTLRLKPAGDSLASPAGAPVRTD